MRGVLCFSAATIGHFVSSAHQLVQHRLFLQLCFSFPLCCVFASFVCLFHFLSVVILLEIFAYSRLSLYCFVRPLFRASMIKELFLQSYFSFVWVKLYFGFVFEICLSAWHCSGLAILTIQPC